MTESQLPDWTNKKMGTKVRAALWLATEVGEGNVYTKDQLRAAFPEAAQVDRRVRELRDHGWVIDTNRDDVSLAQHEARFVQAGERLWEPGVRHMPSRYERSHPLAGLRQVEPERVIEMQGPDLYRVRQPQDPELVWERLKGLSQAERSLILAWIAMGQRPSSPVELAWRAYRSLPGKQRHEVAAKLGELVSSELYEELPVSETRGGER
ncbi:hypothetical protein ACFW6V_32010 [Streptomyces sp. NPDC058734]|uniref:hypothetical protein n=1 Tax=Streptomyces sp. NPDC058734 TaxID=3346615 RepID=UPI0036CA7C58